ncbi:MAG: adenylyltransferase/cytidyltransferase family protein [bacterium]|nr:adenylyltransferase/cytidyltransferase family protein [bacterium]
MAEITPKDFRSIRERYKDKKIVLATGVFDLLHAGHVLFLEDAKKLGDILVVGVGAGEGIKERKDPSRPVLNLAMRMKLVDSIKPVDFVYTSHHQPVHHRLEFLETIFDELRPDVHVANEDGLDNDYRKVLADKHGVKLVILKRWCPPEFEDISTTKLIEKIRSGDK